MKNNENENNISAKDVSTLAKIFGVNFTEKDTETLQSWMDEEENNEVNQP